MAWTKASLKLVLQTDEQKDDGMTYKTKSKTFSNLKQGVEESKCKTVAQAIEGVQEYTLIGLSRVDYTEIEL
jgi:hypothetical protein